MKELLNPIIFFPMLVQLLLAGAAIWYAIETRKLRMQNQLQIDISKKQHFLTVAPFLLIGLISKTKFQAEFEAHPEKFVKEPSEEEFKKKTDRIKHDIAEGSEFFFCNINNPTSKIARDAEVIVYNSNNRNFLLGQYGRAVIEEKQTEIIFVAGNPMSHQEVITAKIQAYPGIDKSKEPLFNYSDISYAIVLYRDIEGSNYAVKRPFVIDASGNITMWRTSFIIL